MHMNNGAECGHQVAAKASLHRNYITIVIVILNQTIHIILSNEVMLAQVVTAVFSKSDVISRPDNAGPGLPSLLRNVQCVGPSNINL